MWSKGSIITGQFSKYKIAISQNRRSFSMSSILKGLSILSGSRGPDGPDLPSPLGRKSQLSDTFQTTCLVMGEVSLEMSPKNIMIQDMINSKTVWLSQSDHDSLKFASLTRSDQ